MSLNNSDLKSRGFSLFEVLVALSILSISVVMIFQLFSIGLRGTKRAENHTQALLIARSLMDEALSMKTIEDGNITVEYDGGYVAKRLIEVVSDDEDTNTRLYRILVSVNWPPSGNLELTTMRVIHEKK